MNPKERLVYEKDLLRLLVAGRISNRMDEIGMTKSDLAKKLGKSRAWVSKLLNGRQNLTLNTLAEVGLAIDTQWEIRTDSPPRPEKEPTK